MDATTTAPSRKPPMWMPAILWLAAVYNILWGTVAIALPSQMFDWADMPPLNYPPIWQGLGMVIAIFGVGYAIAAANPFRFWPVVLMGFLAKLGATAGAAAAFAMETLPRKFCYQTIPNDAIWLIPLALVLHGTWRAAHPRPERLKAGPNAQPARTESGPAAPAPNEPDGLDHGEPYKAAATAALTTVTRQATLHRGHMLSALTLRELSDKTPTLVVFLRHLGCPFCRETLERIALSRKDIEARGVAIVLVHMAQPGPANVLFESYGLDQPDPIWHISDPEQRLYKVFELPRARLGQVLNPTELARGFKVAIVDRHMFGIPRGDSKQLGGAFLFYRRTIIKAYRNARASDRPDVVGIASCPIDKAPPLPVESHSRRSTGVTLS